VLLIDKPHDVLLERLRAIGYECVEAYQENTEELRALIRNCFGVVMRSRVQADADLLGAAPKLAFLAREGVGLEHVDLETARNRSIKVLNSPEGSRDTVAEHSMSLLLSLLNRTAIADRQVRAGSWLREENRATELKGKCVGIIGYGNMGTALAQRLQGFGVKTVAYDRYREHYGDAFAQAVSLETLQDEADIVSLHIPYMAENHHFVNADLLNDFRKPIYLINTSRGLVLHTADLVSAMQEGRVLAAALDVLEYEDGSFNRLNLDALPQPFQYLRQSDRALLSPHIAGWSFESKKGHAEVLADKIESYFGRGDDRH